jgi:type III restriction enzyme
VKFTLKDYQEDAVRDVLTNLAKARKHWHTDGDRYAFALAATTGAGKTVMAAAGLEALFLGSDTYDFEPDPGAVVIWFSDDPSLNEQTRFRLLEASDGLQGRLELVHSRFCREKLDPGKIYFLNTQKLGKKSLLVRGHEPDAAEAAQAELGLELRPDLRSHTIWDTIRNTVEDPALTLYLVLDEAHRGMGTPSKAAATEKSTIVRRLINGAGAVPAIPVVWGISATIERFTEGHGGHAGPRHLSERHRGRRQGAGVRPAQGHHRTGHPAERRPVRHGAAAPRDGEAAGLHRRLGGLCEARGRRRAGAAADGLSGAERTRP